MEPEIASVSQEQRKLAVKLKETLNILDNIKVKNNDSLEYIKEPIDDLMSKLKYLPVEPSFDILPPEIKTKILGYLSTNEARTAASVCQEWKDILLKQNPILLMQNPTNQQGRKSSKNQWPFKELTRFCYKRFVLDLMAGLLLCVLTVNRDEPVQLRTGIQQAGVMLLFFFFYQLEEFKNDGRVAVDVLVMVDISTISTTFLSWAISTYMYKSAQVQCVAILIQFLFFMAFDFYMKAMLRLDEVDWSTDEVDWSTLAWSTLAFSKQSFVSIPFWAISFYLVWVCEYAPAAVLIVATFSILFFSVLASHIRGERT